MVLERVENGDFYGFLEGAEDADAGSAGRRRRCASDSPRRWRPSSGGAATSWSRSPRELSALSDQLAAGPLRDDEARLPEESRAGRRRPADAAAALDARLQELQARGDQHQPAVAGDSWPGSSATEAALRRNVAVLADGQGQPRTIVLADVVRSYQPNAMGLAAKTGHYLAKIWELLTAKPRESNTEGGLFPAIFGTVMLIFLMAVSCFPLGVLAGIYLGEYARDGVLVRLVRIAVNNLAGIPSIVYGIFGLGFFVYGIGAAAGPVVLSGAGGGRQPHLRHRRHPLGQPDAGPVDRPGGDRRHGGGHPRRSRGASAKAPTPWGRPSSRRCCGCSCRWPRRAS